MAAHKGSAVKIKKDGAVICSGINQKDITFNAALIDISEGSNRGHRVLLTVTDSKSLDISFKGVAKDRFLRKLRLTDNNFLENITIEFGNGDTVTGNFMMNSYSESGGFKDAIQFSCDFQSTGTYSYAFSSGENDDGSAGGGGPEVPDAGIYGGMNTIFSYMNGGVSALPSGENIPGLCAAFDLKTMKFNDLYQRYNVVSEISGSFSTERLLGQLIIGDFIFCYSWSYAVSRYAYLVPYLKNENIVANSDDWIANYTLMDGEDVVAIDAETFYMISGAKLIGANKILLLSYYFRDTPQRTATFYIVDVVDQMTHTKIPISVDLDVLGVGSDYSFYEHCGITDPAFNYETGELAAKINVKDDDLQDSVLLLNINPTTGAINSHTFLTGIDDAFGISAMGQLSEITDAVFDYAENYTDDSYYGSFDKTYPRGYETMQKLTYSSRSLSSLPTPRVEFNDSVLLYEVDMKEELSLKLESLGYLADSTEIEMPNNVNMTLIFENANPPHDS